MHFAYLNFITRTTAIAFLIVALQSEYSHGLKCYVCNSAYDEGCDAGQPPMKYLVECTKHTAKPVKFSPPRLPNSTANDGGNADEPSTTSAPGAASTTANTTTSTLEQPTSTTPTPVSTNASSTSTRRDALDESFLYPVELKGINFTTCRKHDATIPQQKNGRNVKEASRRVYRSCGWMDTIANQSVLSSTSINENYTSKDACKWLSKEAITLQLCTCYRDACNSGFKNAVSFSSILFGISALFIY